MNSSISRRPTWADDNRDILLIFGILIGGGTAVIVMASLILRYDAFTVFGKVFIGGIVGAFVVGFPTKWDGAFIGGLMGAVAGLIIGLVL